MITREQALQMVRKHVKNKNLIKHMLAVEAIMRALAARCGEDVEQWGIAGLLHDVDYDQTADDPKNHGLLGAAMLEEAGLDPQSVYAIKVHNEAIGLPRLSLMDKCLYAADPLSGLIVAAALIHPDRKLAAIDVPFIINRFKEKSFARGVSREQLETCSEFNLTLEQFLGLGLRAMQGISSELGL
jgi:putative nucleotidyltransferase with HDIG domain